MPPPRSEFLWGVRAELPILLGVIPFGLIYGVLALDAGLPAGAALAMSSIVFAGSAQFIGAQMLGAGAPGLVIVLTTFIVNLRHMLYSASVAPHLKRLSGRWKWPLAYLLTDEAYAVTITHYRQSPHDPAQRAHRHWYFLGAGVTLWTTWQISTAVGIFLGAQVPDGWSLDFTLALTFIALVVPALHDRPSTASALSAGVVAIVAAGLPYKLGLIAAALTGIGVGLWLETRIAGALHLPASSSSSASGDAPYD
ncbi:MAG TPA: AzlC family ABC transporter permease [Anaerolineae bacterium]|nr:AzlC family ABC transporter permease [Anaerolineae bacterium]